MIILGSFPAQTVAKIYKLQALPLSILWAIIAIAAIAWLLWRMRSHMRHVQDNKQNDGATVALMATACVPLGAALLVGLARSETYGVQVGYAARYTAIATPFWILLFALSLRLLLQRARLCPGNLKAARAPAFATAAMALLLAISNVQWSSISQGLRFYAQLGALHLLLEPTPDSEGLKQYYQQSQRVAAAWPRLLVDRKDFGAEPFAQWVSKSGAIAAPPPEGELQQGCAGRLTLKPSVDTHTTRALEGWATDPAGEPPSAIEIYGGGKLIGAGLQSGRGDTWSAEFINRMPWHLHVVMSLLPPLARAWRLYPGVVAIVRSNALNSSAPADVYLLTHDGHHCRIPSPSIP